MKKFLNDLLIFVLFVATIICAYFSVTVTFSSLLFNFILFFSAIFLLTKTLGLVDKINGFGKYKRSNTDNSTQEGFFIQEDPDEDNQNINIES